MRGSTTRSPASPSFNIAGTSPSPSRPWAPSEPQQNKEESEQARQLLPGPGRLFCRKYRPFPNLRSHGRVPAAAKTVLRGTRVSVTSAPAPVGGGVAAARSGAWEEPGAPPRADTLVLAPDAGPCRGLRSLRGRASRPDLALAAMCLLLLPPSRFQQAGARAQRHGAFETVLGGQQNPCPTSSPRSVGGSRRRIRAGGAGPRGAPAAPVLAPLR